ncbi:hypothetical protein D9M70_640510 [compost metagenome]
MDFDIKNATNKQFFDFFETVLPDYDRERVYATDVKKIINWYNIISEHLPEAFEEKAESSEEKND